MGGWLSLPTARRVQGKGDSMITTEWTKGYWWGLVTGVVGAIIGIATQHLIRSTL